MLTPSSSLQSTALSALFTLLRLCRDILQWTAAINHFTFQIAWIAFLQCVKFVCALLHWNHYNGSYCSALRCMSVNLLCNALHWSRVHLSAWYCIAFKLGSILKQVALLHTVTAQHDNTIQHLPSIQHGSIGLFCRRELRARPDSYLGRETCETFAWETAFSPSKIKRTCLYNRVLGERPDVAPRMTYRTQNF